MSFIIWWLIDVIYFSPVRPNVLAWLPDFDEDARVGDDDGQTGDEETENEEEFLGRFAVAAA